MNITKPEGLRPGDKWLGLTPVVKIEHNLIYFVEYPPMPTGIARALIDAGNDEVEREPEVVGIVEFSAMVHIDHESEMLGWTFEDETPLKDAGFRDDDRVHVAVAPIDQPFTVLPGEVVARGEYTKDREGGKKVNGVFFLEWIRNNGAEDGDTITITRKK